MLDQTKPANLLDIHGVCRSFPKGSGEELLVLEKVDLTIKSGEIVGSGDYDTFVQGCIAVEMAVRSIRKEDVPKELMLKPVVIDKTNYTLFDQPYEKRECPTLANVDRQ